MPFPFSMRDIDPDYIGVVDTTEQTIPDVEESKFYETTPDNKPITKAHSISFVGVLFLFIVLVVVLGYEKKIK
jgi:hypothetical protein